MILFPRRGTATYGVHMRITRIGTAAALALATAALDACAAQEGEPVEIDPDAPTSSTADPSSSASPAVPPDGGSGAASDPDAVVSSPAVHTDPDPAAITDPPLTDPRDDLVHEHWTEWQSAVPTGDSTVRVEYWNGTETCYGARAVVEETDSEVRIAIVTGTLPEAPDACIAIAKQDFMEVTTAAPLDGREITVLPEAEAGPLTP